MPVVTTTTTTSAAGGAIRTETVTVATPDITPAQHPDFGMRVPYEVRDSAIGGRGLYATAAVKKGTMLWEYCDASVKEYDEESLKTHLKTMAPDAIAEFCEHVFCWDGKVVEIQGDGKMWNHSKTVHNTGNHPNPALHDGVSTYALRDIEAGEEFLDNYQLYATLAWFEEICRQQKAVSCIEVGEMYD